MRCTCLKKLTLLLIILLPHVVAAAQNITLSETKAPLEKVLKSIKKQSGYSIFYDDQLLRRGNQVDIHVKNVSLANALDMVFKDQPFTYEIVANRIISIRERKETPKTTTRQISEQARIIKGIIRGENEEGLEGASIRIKGGTKSWTTSRNGTFEITVEDSDVTLEITYVGYERQEISVGNRTELLIILKKNLSPLEEVVVVGFGRQKKATVTGAISSVGTKELVQSPQANISNALVVACPVCWRCSVAVSPVRISLHCV